MTRARFDRVSKDPERVTVKEAANECRAIRVGLCLILVLSTVSCAYFERPDPKMIPAPKATPDSAYLPATYLLTPGDLLDVRFFYNEELNDRLPVRPDGMITLQLIGDVRAAGVAPSDLGKHLNTEFAKFLPHPNVAIIVKEYTPQQVFVGGEVERPGSVVVHGALTTTQAILERGGAKMSARLGHVVLVRYEGPGEMSIHVLDLKKVMKGDVADTMLRPYDVIYVPKTPIAQLGQFVEQYINNIVPDSVSFPFVYRFTALD